MNQTQTDQDSPRCRVWFNHWFAFHLRNLSKFESAIWMKERSISNRLNATGRDGQPNPIRNLPDDHADPITMTSAADRSITEPAAPRVDLDDRFADVDSSDCVIPRLLTVSISPFRLMMISSGRHFPRNSAREGCSKRANSPWDPRRRTKAVLTCRRINLQSNGGNFLFLLSWLCRRSQTDNHRPKRRKR